MTAAEDARLAVIAVAVVLGWPSARGFEFSNIVGQLRCTTATLTRSIARFNTLAGLAGGGVQFICNGAGSGGDKPAAVRA